MGRHLTLVVCAAFLALAPGRSDAAQTYKVKKGDSLERIAKTLRVGVDDLKAANGLQSNLLRTGTKLKVPLRSEKTKTEGKKAARSEARAEKARTEPSGAERTALQEAGAGHEEGPRRSVSHVVKKGDTLHAIARAFDVPVQDLQRFNGIGKKGRLKPGMTLVVKPGGDKSPISASAMRKVQKTYAVQKGDNLSRIAKKFHVSSADLKRLNHLRSDRLKLGQRLVVSEQMVARGDDDSEERVVESRLDEAKISAALQEFNAQAQEEGTDVSATDRMMQVAKRMLGIPYRFGGNTTRGIDCSAYVQKVFRFLNLPLPRTAREQYAVGKEVSKGELTTGDLVFFRTYARYPSHVGIYLGDSKFIHASSMGKKVTIDSLETPFYNQRYIGAKRLVEEEEPKAQSAPVGDSSG